MTGGWASQLEQRTRLLSYLPFDDEDEEPAYAVADAWEPPHPLALPAALCDRLVTAAEETEAGPRPNGSYHYIDLEPEDREAIVSRFEEANALWWRLDIDRWDVKVKRYADGDHHSEHQDLHADAARRKMAGSVQLSDPGDYVGGALVMRFAGQRISMPRTRGTMVAFPGWTVHEVEPVTGGQRWALIVNGFGPPLR